MFITDLSAYQAVNRLLIIMLIIGYIFSWISRQNVDHKFEHMWPKLTQCKMWSTDRKLTQS